ncbi:uncharacterized protein LOC135161837 [Diachasmimorpha longicaudata]|uniref:uncharacterized protein LOC135161837 n=1 Tax=Diachasmimorpha longicaudata TaxID=58733 RepID=UPI0030B91522
MALDNLEPTDVFFEKILHRGLRDTTIQDVVLIKKESATQKGDNFLSLLTRLTLRYVCNASGENCRDKIERTAHLIVKEEPIVSETALESIREMDIFNTERQLLEEVLPRIEELVGRKLAPKVYYSSTDPQIIVMEDISAQGFKNSSRLLGLNQAQVLMVLESLADLHAGSVLINEQTHGSLKKYSWGLVNPDMPANFFKTMQATVANVARAIGSWPDKKFIPISKKLEKISHHVIERMKEVCLYDSDEFCVLNHGDVWSTNIMFQNDETGKLKDVRLLDYQFVVWSSPVIDLCYFLNGAPEPSLKGPNDYLFFEKYLNRLSATMKKIGCVSKAPTMEDLKKSLYKRRILLLLCGVWFYPKMIAEGGELETIEDIFYTEKNNINIMQNAKVKAVIEKMLPLWNDRPVRDELIHSLGNSKQVKDCGELVKSVMRMERYRNFSYCLIYESLNTTLRDGEFGRQMYHKHLAVIPLLMVMIGNEEEFTQSHNNDECMFDRRLKAPYKVSRRTLAFRMTEKLRNFYRIFLHVSTIQVSSPALYQFTSSILRAHRFLTDHRINGNVLHLTPLFLQNRASEDKMALANLAPGDIFFQNILHRGLKDQTIQDVMLVEKKPAVNKGDNYMSELTRFTLKYKCKEPKERSNEKVEKLVCLIIKEEPNATAETLELIRNANIFNIERSMLEEVIPRIEELIGKRIGPKFYYSSVEPPIIVMEDLAALGFKNKNRKVGLNEAQIFLILENLADFHAASVLLNEQDPQFVSRFTNGLVSKNTSKMMFNYLSKGLEDVAREISTWGDEQFILIAEKIKKRGTAYAEQLMNIYQHDEDELKVLNHGDVWINNIMFRDDDNGRSLEIRLVDYQLTVWASPATELLYFLGVAPERSLKLTHDDVFLEKYLTHLTSTMEKLGCRRKPPTMGQLKRSMHKRRSLGLLATLVFWPRMLSEEGDVEAIDEIFQNTGESRGRLLKYPEAKEMLTKVLPILDERGYLNLPQILSLRKSHKIDNELNVLRDDRRPVNHNMDRGSISSCRVICQKYSRNDSSSWCYHRIMTLFDLAVGEDIFRKTLLHRLKDPTIRDVMLVEIKPAVEEGENYMSELTKFTLSYSCDVADEDSSEEAHEVVYLIAKEEPNGNEWTLENIRMLNFFNTERALLEEVIPRIEELTGTLVGPKFFYFLSEPQAIIMEDLAASGFENKDRKLGLNEDQVFLVLEKLADFHAASVLLNEQDPHFVSRFTSGLFNDNLLGMLTMFMSKALEAVAERIETWPDKQFALIAEKLRDRSKDVGPELGKLYQCDEDEIRVLNHGDLWINNIMIRDNEYGKPEDARFVDYQMPIWGSPAIDLLYFLSLSPKRDLKMSHDSLFLEKYLTRLASTMKKLGCSKAPPTLDQLTKSMLSRRAVTLYATFFLWPKLLAEVDDVEDFYEIVDHGGVTKAHPLKYVHAQKVFKKILPILNERGYLDSISPPK